MKRVDALLDLMILPACCIVCVKAKKSGLNYLKEGELGFAMIGDDEVLLPFIYSLVKNDDQSKELFFLGSFVTSSGTGFCRRFDPEDLENFEFWIFEIGEQLQIRNSVPDNSYSPTGFYDKKILFLLKSIANAQLEGASA